MKDQFSSDKDNRLDAFISNATEEALGPKQRTFRPDTTNIFAGFMFAFIFIVGGLGASLGLATVKYKRKLETSDHIAKYAFIIAFSTVGPAAGIGMIVWMRRLMTHRVDIHDNGFLFCYCNSTETCTWKEISRIEQLFMKESVQVLKVPGASIKTTGQHIFVIRRDDMSFMFNGDSIKKLNELVDIFKDIHEKYDIPWKTIEDTGVPNEQPRTTTRPGSV